MDEILLSSYLKQPCGKRRWECTTLYFDAVADFAILHHMASAIAAYELKKKVAEFWNAEPCGTRYLDGELDFEKQARTRYELEPHIPGFANFAASADLRVLEIGVGLGADYEQWLKSGASATGIDVSTASLDQTRRRCEMQGLKPDLRVADAENLPFEDQMFDVVYSYGVMHHSPDTQKCVSEAWRVLKPEGEARIMLYQHPSITGFMLWLRYGWWRGQSIRRCVYERLESPGTKTFTIAEVRAMFAAFEVISVDRVFSPGDLLKHKPSPRFRGGIYRWIWKLFPRKLAGKFGQRWGLFLLITARKPKAANRQG
jgi:SAM-dependent methyltransferase